MADFFREHDRKAIAAEQSSLNEEWLIFADDGHRELVETIKIPIYDADGQLMGVLGVARDITEKKRSEEELRQQRSALSIWSIRWTASSGKSMPKPALSPMSANRPNAYWDLRWPPGTRTGSGWTGSILKTVRGCRPIVAKNGYATLVATTPQQALDLCAAKNQRIDLLLTDVIMPEMNGRELSRQIGLLRPGIKVLFMSGYAADIMNTTEAPDVQVPFIQKPFSLRTLLAKIEEQLREGGGDGAKAI